VFRGPAVQSINAEPDFTEVRVLGCLIEKQRATPAAYPLSLNALRLACNQATNRDPVVELDEEEIRKALGTLGRRGWIRSTNLHGGRAAKYRHQLEQELRLSDAQLSVMCVLMLRGAQTPGELKQRTERLHPFGDLGEVRQTLEALIERDLAARLPRRPGQKEERYEQRLGGLGQEEDAADSAPAATAAEPAPTAEAPPAADHEERIGRLEREVAELRERVTRP
jgi:hypothetical protein